MNMNGCLHIHLDFESYSKVDLTKIGVYKYADHPSTDVLLASYAIGGTDPARWRPGDPYPFADVHDRLGNDAFILAWNSNFERIMWQRVMCERYGWPMLPLHAFICVAAWARDTAASPSKLEMAGMFFDRHTQKDMKGHRLMLQMCKPATEAQQLKWLQKEGRAMFARGCVEEEVQYAADRCHHTPENLARLHTYCDGDVEVERGIAEILPEWDWQEVEQFWESERINDRGLCVDVEFAAAAADFADEEKADLADRLHDVTDGEVSTPRQFARFQAWALPRMSKAAVKLTTWYDNDVKKHTFDADARANLMAACEDDPEFLSDEVLEAVKILDEAGKSTISKYISIRDRASTNYNDGRERVHGLYMFAGGAQTGRYSSVGIQAHNLVRDVPKEAGDQIEAFVSRNDRRIRSFGAPIHTLGKLVRPTITGDPKDEFDLIWGDWSSVEAILLPWLSLDPDAEDVLATFRRGEDIYIKTAAAILGKPPGQITKEERQSHGKVPVLSLGYGGGQWAFKAMAKNYGVRMDDKTVERIIKNWRAANPWAQRFGKACEAAAQTAMDLPGRDYSAGRVSYRLEPDALGGMGALFCTLPSGRRICYPDPSIEIVEKEWGDTLCILCRKGAWRPAKDSTEWPRIAVWKGLMVENCLAENTEVLTSAGWLPIQDVKPRHLLWDGQAWVAHDGVVAKGTQACTSLYGLTLTPDHEVLTNAGWMQAAEAQRHRYDRKDVWLPDGTTPRSHTRQERLVDVPLHLRNGEGGDDSARLSQRTVYDIVNAGCRNQFVARGTDGPVIVHNCTQAAQADLLRLKIAEASLHGLKLVGHTHDEILAESRYPEEDAPKLKALMEARPGWSGDDNLPLRAEVEYGYRYKVPFE